MNLWSFANEHPFVFAFLVCSALTFLFRCWNRTLRSINIRKHGWPPPHCDADGDLKPDESQWIPSH